MSESGIPHFDEDPTIDTTSKDLPARSSVFVNSDG